MGFQTLLFRKDIDTDPCEFAYIPFQTPFNCGKDIEKGLRAKSEMTFQTPYIFRKDEFWIIFLKVFDAFQTPFLGKI
jgi:hypothetical protein